MTGFILKGLDLKALSVDLRCWASGLTPVWGGGNKVADNSGVRW
jgi:hypothetical protein